MYTEVISTCKVYKIISNTRQYLSKCIASSMVSGNFLLRVSGSVNDNNPPTKAATPNTVSGIAPDISLWIRSA